MKRKFLLVGRATSLVVCCALLNACKPVSGEFQVLSDHFTIKDEFGIHHQISSGSHPIQVSQSHILKRFELSVDHHWPIYIKAPSLSSLDPMAPSTPIRFRSESIGQDWDVLGDLRHTEKDGESYSINTICPEGSSSIGQPVPAFETSKYHDHTVTQSLNLRFTDSSGKTLATFQKEDTSTQVILESRSGCQ